MESPVRAFVAFEIPVESREEIGRFCASAGPAGEGNVLRWVRPEVLHMTVRFFGDLDRKALGKAERAISGLDRAWSPPPISFGSLGGFPSLARAQVLWLGVEDPGKALGVLAAEVDRAIRVVGFGPADKPFVAHLTLARAGRGLRAPDLRDWSRRLTPPRGALRITAVTLFRSDLRPQGAIYTPLVTASPRSETDAPD
jgi:2'-5' RNA ligase